MERNYEFGINETITNQLLLPLVLDTKSGFLLDDIYSFAMAEPVISTDSAGAVIVPVTAYDLVIDAIYTANEAEDGGTAKTIYKSITITNATYAGVDLYISGLNYGSYTDNEAVQSQINSILSGTAQLGIGGRIPFATYEDRTSQGLFVDAYDNAISQANYAQAFAEIGHMYNTQHVAAGDADLSASSTLFYPTPVPSSFTRSAIPDISFTDADLVTSSTTPILNLLSGGEQSLRNGTAFKFNIVSGTGPTGFTDNTIYYIRPSVNTPNYDIKVYPTEADAIAASNPISLSTTGSGTFRLTQAGIKIDFAVEEHEHNYSVRQGGAGGGDTYIASSNGGTVVKDNGARAQIHEVQNANVSNETRPDAVYMYWYTKIESVLPTGEVPSALRYEETIVGTLWQNQQFVITHGLNAPNEMLSVKIEAEEDGLWSMQEVKTITINADDYGVSIVDTGSTSSITIQTGANGVLGFTSIGVRSGLVNGNNGKLRVTVNKPNLFASSYTPTSVVRNVSTSADVVDTLPLASESIAQKTYYITCTSTGKHTLNAQGTDKIIMNGDELTTVDTEGANTFALTPVGGNWRVDAYEDSGGSTNNWIKTKDGTVKEWGGQVFVFSSEGAKSENVSLESSFISAPTIIVGAGLIPAVSYIYMGVGATSAVTFEYRAFAESASVSGTTQSIAWTAYGTWR